MGRRRLNFSRRKQLRPGRPVTGKDILNKAIRVNQETIHILDLERKSGETYNDVLVSIWRERNFLRQELSKVREIPAQPPT